MTIMSSEMIERVARALYWKHVNPDRGDVTLSVAVLDWDDLPDSGSGAKLLNKDFWLDAARAAIAAMREPTEKMVGAGTDEASNQDMLQIQGIPEVYRAMIDAALDEKAKP